MDADLAVGREPALAADLAADVVTDLLTSIATLSAPEHPDTIFNRLCGSGETLQLHATDVVLGGTGRWLVRRTPVGVRWEHGQDTADVTVPAAALDLLLVLNRRATRHHGSTSWATGHSSPTGLNTAGSDAQAVTAALPGMDGATSVGHAGSQRGGAPRRLADVEAAKRSAGTGTEMATGPSTQFRILGPLEVLVDGVPLDLGGPRHRILLATLLVYAGKVVSADRMIEALWGETPPASAASMLHVRVSELRKALRPAGEAADILTRGSGYVLRVDGDDIDAERFRRLVVTGRQVGSGGDHESASARLRDALSLWRGPALADVADRPFARAEIARLDALRVQALEDRVEADLAVGRHEELVVELTGLVNEQPLRERLHGQLMLALYRAGRQGEALEAFQAARTVLVERLGIEPGNELQRLQAAILRHDPALDQPRAASAPRLRTSSVLPTPITTFIGRRHELGEVRDELGNARLVTIVGVGGVGKSRLAVEVARRWVDEHSDGCWVVELAALNQPGLLAQTLAATIGIRESPQHPLVGLLTDRLAGETALLVLDNCDHLLQEAAELTETLLHSCPRLRILATSRERLGVTGEVLRPLSGLTVPLPGTRDVAAVRRCDAVALLIERAVVVTPDFQLSDRTVDAAAQICQRLDGLPLAIELAAARVNAIDVEHIAARLDDRFGLLAGGSRTALPRHQTLRAVVDWSYDLLSGPQQRMFERLCVFSGGFTLEAVEAVCVDTDENAAGLAGLLARLVDKSLVVAEPTNTAGIRYRMLETLLVYGLERLTGSGLADQVRQRHAAYILALAERAGAALRGREQSAWLARLRVEHNNIRAALDWSLGQGDAATAARLAGALYQFWDLHGHYTEGRRWLTGVLAMTGPMPPAARVRALLACGGLAAIQGDLADATARGEQAASICKRAGDPNGMAHALQFLGFVAVYGEDHDRATRLLDDALRNARTAKHRWLEGRSLLFLAIAALASGDYDRADRLAIECAEVLEPVGDADSLTGTLVIRATVAWRHSDEALAATSLRQGLRAYQGLGDLWGLSLGLALVAYLAGTRGDYRQLAVLLGASEAVRESVGAALLPFVDRWHRTAIGAAEAALGVATFKHAWQTGHTMTPDRAVSEALRDLELISFPADGAAASPPLDGSSTQL
jgi:predicted ATPase/DNA-binding SARP family transcriptional activator